TLDLLLRYGLEQQVLFELHVEDPDRTANCSQSPSLHIVGHAIGAPTQSSKLDLPFPLGSVECVIHVPGLADSMSFRAVEADVVELSQILASGEHLLFVDIDPLREVRLLFRRQVQTVSLGRPLGPGEVRPHDPTDPDGGSKIVSTAAQFDMIAEVGDRVSVQRLERFTLGSY